MIASPNFERRGLAPLKKVKMKMTKIQKLTTALFCYVLQILLAQTGARAHAQGSEPELPVKSDEKESEKPSFTQPPRALLAYELGLQATLIDQNLFRFRSKYQGTNSLKSRNENEKSDTYTLYLGLRLNPSFEFFINPEMARGNGISEALGLAGFTNGDVIRNPTLGMDPYLGRYFVRITLPTGKKTDLEAINAGENQILGKRPKNRLVISAGKLGASDIFDQSGYANSTRTQFMNWSLLNNGAYDYAADTRGYTQGVAVEWIHPKWSVRFGSFQMPTEANGATLSIDFQHNRGDQIEVELHPELFKKQSPLVVRLLAYRNLARMGDYRESLQLAQQNGAVPDITATRKRDRIKYGFGLNFEQPLGDSDGTALFGRFGWDDGATESFAYTEIDRTMCLGLQISGKKWHRSEDRLSFAVVQNDLATVHKQYLERGGQGFLLGDGALNYGSERIFESYYSYQLLQSLALAVDYQFIANPGYNRDRGPLSVLSARVHLEF